MKNDQVHPELVSLFVALDEVYNEFCGLADTRRYLS